MKVLTAVFLFGVCAFSRAAPDPGVEFRHALSLHLSSLAEKAELAIRRKVIADHGEENVGSRRYFSGDIDGDGKEDLLLVTSFTNAEGNYWSHDFVLVLSSAPDHPVFKNFGGKGKRSYDSISMSKRGISVEFRYYAATDALCCPSIKKKGRFVLKSGELIEEKEPDTSANGPERP